MGRRVDPDSYVGYQIQKRIQILILRSALPYLNFLCVDKYHVLYRYILDIHFLVFNKLFVEHILEIKISSLK
jgi:hypothetical protein